MTEFDDIFTYDLTTIVFVWSSIPVLIAFTVAALWPLRSAHGATGRSADRAWLGANSSSPAPATRL